MLENAIRNDPVKIADFVENGCVEIPASGGERQYKTGEVFENVDGELYILSNSVKLIDLSEDCKLLLYVAGKVSKNSRIKSNRSSIWKNIGGQWKVIFHQGTNCAE